MHHEDSGSKPHRDLAKQVDILQHSDTEVGGSLAFPWLACPFLGVLEPRIWKEMEEEVGEGCRWGWRRRPLELGDQSLKEQGRGCGPSSPGPSLEDSKDSRGRRQDSAPLSHRAVCVASGSHRVDPHVTRCHKDAALLEDVVFHPQPRPVWDSVVLSQDTVLSGSWDSSHFLLK